MSTDQQRRIKPIATRYGGLLFRSRLEARWALFFDRLHIPWEYEPQGFDVGGRPYLPDFLLGLGRILWAEVKPSVGADPDGEERWRSFLDAQPEGTRGVLLTPMTGQGQQFLTVEKCGERGDFQLAEDECHMWLSCSEGYHFDLQQLGSTAGCAQCGETRTCSSCDGTGLHKGGPVICYCCAPPGSGRVPASKNAAPWDLDKRVENAYDSARSERFDRRVSSG